MEGIIQYTSCYLLHKSIVFSLDDKAGCVNDMKKMIERSGEYGINDITNNYNKYINELTIKMYDYYDIYFREVYGCNVSKVCDKVHKRLTSDVYCTTTGVGYLIYSKTWRLPKNWCIRQECYDSVKLDEKEWLALKIYNIDLFVNNVAGQVI